MKTLQRISIGVLGIVGLATLGSFTTVPPAGPGCNENLAKAALLSNPVFRACADSHRPNGIAFAVNVDPPRDGKCTYSVYAYDPFRCPPGQICPLVLIAPFAYCTVDGDFNVTSVVCDPFGS